MKGQLDFLMMDIIDITCKTMARSDVFFLSNKFKSTYIKVNQNLKMSFSTSTNTGSLPPVMRIQRALASAGKPSSMPLHQPLRRLRDPKRSNLFQSRTDPVNDEGVRRVMVINTKTETGTMIDRPKTPSTKETGGVAIPTSEPISSKPVSQETIETNDDVTPEIKLKSPKLSSDDDIDSKKHETETKTTVESHDPSTDVELMELLKPEESIGNDDVVEAVDVMDTTAPDEVHDDEIKDDTDSLESQTRKLFSTSSSKQLNRINVEDLKQHCLNANIKYPGKKTKAIASLKKWASDDKE